MGINVNESVIGEWDLPSEETILSRWNGSISMPVVSICCITYNHAQYIEDALKSFLCQVTDFSFEILINDDASTDETPEIIRKYADAYPRLIKPIYQVENKYSKGFKPNPSFNFPRVKGEYVAMCEGDDCWLSRNKLQRQYDISTEYPVSVVFHSAIELNMDVQERKIVSRQREGDGFVSLGKSVKGRGAFMPTASLFFPAKIIKDRLHWFDNDWPVGDFFLQMILSFEGNIFYIDEPMCLYRRNVPGSWTDAQKHKSQALKYHKAMVKGILELYALLGDHRKKYLLAYPAFFYTKGLLFNIKEPLTSLFQVLSAMSLWNVSWLFKIIYLTNVLYYPLSMICRKVMRLRGRF